MRTYYYDQNHQHLSRDEVLALIRAPLNRRYHDSYRLLCADGLLRGRLLDLGCNIGVFSSYIAERHPDVHVVGIDNRPEAIDLAKEFLGERDNLAFAVVDFLNSDYPDGSFDYIIFLEVIEHVSNPHAYLAECARVLKPSGVLVLSTPNIISTHDIAKQLVPNLTHWLHIIEKEPQDTGTHLDHIYAWNIYALCRLLYRSGFHYETHRFCNFEIPLLGTLPFDVPWLSRLSRTMILKMRKRE